MRSLPLVLILAAVPAVGQTPLAAPCRAALPAEFAGWGEQTPVSAGLKSGEGATLEVGHAALVSLHAAKHLQFPVPAKATDANGGTLALAITKPGTYRIALGEVASVDLVRDGKAVSSRPHGGAAATCSGIRRMVDFTLDPGNYTIQLSGSPSDTIALMVVRV